MRGSADATICTVTVANTGAIAADYVVLLWAEAPGVQTAWARKLAGSVRVLLAPGETRIATTTILLQSLRCRDPATQQWRLEAGEWRFLIADRAEAAGSAVTTLRL